MAFFDRFLTNIGRLQQEKDRPDQFDSLDSEDPGERARAAHAICSSGISAATDLLEVLENAHPTSRVRMAEALASTGAPSVPLLLALLLRANPAVQTSVIRAIARAGDGMFEALLPALHHEQPTVRLAAVIALRGAGKKAVTPLVEALRDRNRSVRREAAVALATLHWTPDDLPGKVWFYLILEDWSELAKLQGAAVPALVKSLASKEPRIRSESVRTLGKIRDARAIPALIKAVKDPQQDVRIRAAEALGEIGDDRAKSVLIEALNDSCHPVRMEAAWALDRLDWIPENDLQRAEYLIAREQWNELVRMGGTVIPLLIRALEVEYSGIRTGASEALRQLGQPALEALNAAVRSDNSKLREEAQIALDYIKSRQAENSRPRAVQENPSNYERELREGLAARKRIEARLGPTTRVRDSPSRRAPPMPAQTETVQPATDGETVAPEPVTQPPTETDDPELTHLLAEDGEAEEALAGVAASLEPARSVSFDEIVPPLDEGQTIGDTGEHAEEEASPSSGSGRMTLVEPDVPAEPPEPAGRAPEKASIERYLTALRSDDETVRAAAIEALRSLGEPAIEFLVEALSDSHYNVRIAAAEGLGEIGDASGVNPLILLAGDAERDVRIAAATALGRIGDARALASLIGLFGDSYPRVRSAASTAVAAFGAEALEPLETALDDPMPAVRLTAARAIGLVGNPRSIPFLVERLEDPAREVGMVAAQVLAGFGHSAVEPLLLVLREGGKEGRLLAIDALAKIGSEEADEALEYALHDQDEEVRKKAAVALRRRQGVGIHHRAPGNPVREEIATLITALKDRSVEVQVSAATRLIRMGRPAAEGLILALKSDDPELQAAAAGILGEMREAAVEPLMNALNDRDRFIRLTAARNLGNIGDPQAIEVLSESLRRESDSGVRAAVAEALGYVGSRQAIEPLALALRDSDEGVKVAAARSLGYIEDLRAIEPLIQALNDVDDRVRYAALEAMKDPGGKMRTHLTDALRSGDERLRAGVAEALEAVGWRPKSREDLTLYLMARDRWAEVERVGVGALPVLAAALSDPSIEIRTNAVRTITRIGGEGAVAPLIRSLQDDALAVRMRAERALVDMGSAALPALVLAVDGAEKEGRLGLQRIVDAIRARESPSSGGS